MINISLVRNALLLTIIVIAFFINTTLSGDEDGFETGTSKIMTGKYNYLCIYLKDCN